MTDPDPNSPLTNRWMNDPQFLAQAGHTLGGAMIVLFAAVLLGFARWPYALAAVAAAAALKEFVYDARFELPRQTRRDNLMDWTFYVLGGALGALAAWFAHHLHRIG